MNNSGRPPTNHLNMYAANVWQYNQAHGTQFGSKPMLSYIGYSTNKEGTNSILRNKRPDQSITKDLLPETKAIINTLSNLDMTQHPPLPTTINPSSITQLYQFLMSERHRPLLVDTWDIMRLQQPMKD